MPRPGRALVYLGVVILVLNMALLEVIQGDASAVASAARILGPAQDAAQNAGADDRYSIRSTFLGLGLLTLAPVYFAWLIWKHPERLIGDILSRCDPRPVPSEVGYPPSVHMYKGWVAFIFGFVGGYFVANFTPIVLKSIIWVDWEWQITIVLAVSVLVVGTIAYFKGALSRNIVAGAVGILVGLLGVLLM
jgi:hypothetical protein